MPKAPFTKAAIRRAWEAAKEAGIEHPLVRVSADGSLEISEGVAPAAPDPRMHVYELEEEDDLTTWRKAKGYA